MMRSLVKGLNLPTGTSTYSFRHKFITDALAAGVPIAAVAKHCGTSVEMISKSYAKFSTVQMKEWFA
jgi:integrase